MIRIYWQWHWNGLKNWRHMSTGSHLHHLPSPKRLALPHQVPKRGAKARAKAMGKIPLMTPLWPLMATLFLAVSETYIHIYVNVTLKYTAVYTWLTQKKCWFHFEAFCCVMFPYIDLHLGFPASHNQNPRCSVTMLFECGFAGCARLNLQVSRTSTRKRRPNTKKGAPSVKFWRLPWWKVWRNGVRRLIIRSERRWRRFCFSKWWGVLIFKFEPIYTLKMINLKMITPPAWIFIILFKLSI